MNAKIDLLLIGKISSRRSETIKRLPEKPEPLLSLARIILFVFGFQNSQGRLSKVYKTMNRFKTLLLSKEISTGNHGKTSEAFNTFCSYFSSN